MRLSRGPLSAGHAAPARRRTSVLLGALPARRRPGHGDQAALIQVIETGDITARWYELAERAFALPEPVSVRHDMERLMMAAEPPAARENRIVLVGRHLLRRLEHHRRSVLDWAAVLPVVLSVTALVLAFLHDSIGKLSTSDLVQVGSIFAAAAGILIGIGGPRGDSPGVSRGDSAQ